MSDFADSSHRDLALSAADELEAMLATLSRLDISDFENSRRRQRDEQDPRPSRHDAMPRR